MSGLSDFRITREESESALWRRLDQVLREELVLLRAQNDHEQTIASTTLLRGQIAFVKRILARTSEVGPESRQSEPAWPESAIPARTAPGMPEGY